MRWDIVYKSSVFQKQVLGYHQSVNTDIWTELIHMRNKLYSCHYRRFRRIIQQIQHPRFTSSCCLLGQFDGWLQVPQREGLHHVAPVIAHHMGVGGGGLSLWKSTHMDHTNRPKAASQMSPQWLAWRKHVYTCAHTHIQLNLPQDYSYTRPDDQANCVPLFWWNMLCCHFQNGFFLFMEGCLLVWKMMVSGLTGRTEGDLVMTCFCIRTTLNDTSFFSITSLPGLKFKVWEFQTHLKALQRTRLIHERKLAFKSAWLFTKEKSWQNADLTVKLSLTSLHQYDGSLIYWKWAVEIHLYAPRPTNHS